MAVADYRDHTSYHLEIMTIVNNEGEAFDVRQLFIQCFINESIYDNFLSGEVVIADSIGLLEKVKFSGQESIRIRFHQPAKNPNDTIHEDDVIDKVFRIYRVNDLKRTHEHSQVFNLMFASPELLDSKRIRISQSFKGEVLSLAAKIAEDHLGIANEIKDTNLEPFFEWRAPASEEHHVTIPNWTVQQTINWLCSKAQANSYNSSPLDSYFFYQTANGNFRINSLRDMFNTWYLGEADLEKGVFVYTDYGNEAPQAVGDEYAHYDSQSPDKLGSGRRILDYHMSSTSNVLDATILGLLGSKLYTINNTGKYFQEKTYDYLERFYGDDKNPPGLENQPFIRTSDETIYIGAKQGDPNTDTTTDGVYNTYKPLNRYADAYHLLLNQSEFVNDDRGVVKSINGNAHFGGQQMRQAVGALMKFHTIQCLISTRTDISSGQMINLKIPKAEANQLEYDDGTQFHDGAHLITNVQWAFNQAICNTNISCFKNNVRNNLETTTASYSGPDTQGFGAL